ncbi:hypothetical protein [Bradyrhizobium sp. USDA 4512]
MTIALGFPLGFARARRAAASIGVVLALGAVLSAAIDTAAAQNLPAKRAPAQGGGSTQAIAAQLKNAIALTRSGKFDAGYAQLLAALDAADKLDDAQFVMEQYFDATATLRAVKRDDLAEKLFVRAFQSKAAAQRPPGNADVLLMYAILLSDHARIAEAVPLYMKAIAAFNAYWGEGSEESLIANDKLAVALSANGSAASATNLGRHNFERAEKALGPDHRTTWKLANNYADMLREIGAPAKALELDLFAIEKRAQTLWREPSQHAGDGQQRRPGFPQSRPLRRRPPLFPPPPRDRGRDGAEGSELCRTGRRLAVLHRHARRRRCRDRAGRSGAAGGDRRQ